MMRSMALSLPAKTGWRTYVSTRSIMVDSRCMTMALIISTDELPDVLSFPPQVAYQSSRSSPIATRWRVRRLQAGLPPAGLAAGPGTRGTGLVPQGPGRWSSGTTSGGSSATPSRPSRAPEVPLGLDNLRAVMCYGDHDGRSSVVRALGVDADRVALEGVVPGAGVAEVDTVVGISRDHVGRALLADVGELRLVGDRHAEVVRQGHSAGDVGAEKARRPETLAEIRRTDHLPQHSPRREECRRRRMLVCSLVPFTTG